ncbi:hypothetical protein G7046_g9539 [Stylonectria norvegica]|nr:hypothetical protein G7046_g9539 [Stylonectria norvegica]
MSPTSPAMVMTLPSPPPSRPLTPPFMSPTAAPESGGLCDIHMFEVLGTATVTHVSLLAAAGSVVAGAAVRETRDRL